MSKFVHHLILKYKFYKYFPISSDFCVKIDYFALKCLILNILSLVPLLISFIRLWTTLVKNLYTIWSLNINSTNIFHFLVIFAQNLDILPQKPEVTHFPEVYQTFSHFWNIIETNHSSHLLSSENSHGSQICYITNSTILNDVSFSFSTFAFSALAY